MPRRQKSNPPWRSPKAPLSRCPQQEIKWKFAVGLPCSRLTLFASRMTTLYNTGPW